MMKWSARLLVILSATISSCRDNEVASVATPPAPTATFATTNSPERILGPYRVDRADGKPNVQEMSFTIPAYEAYQQPVLIRLTNGAPDGTSRVSSAAVYIDGVEVVAPSTVNQQTGSVERTFTINQSGKIVVEVRSIPTAYVTVEVNAQFKPGFGRVGSAGATVTSDDGAAEVQLAGRQQADAIVKFVRLDRVMPTKGVNAGATYELSARIYPESSSAIGARVQTAGSAVDWNQAIDATVRLPGTAIEPTHRPDILIDFGPDAGAGPMSLFDVRQVAGRYEGTVTLPINSMALNLGPVLFRNECGVQSILPTSETSGEIPVIFIHGWQPERTSCEDWEDFPEEEQGSVLLDHITAAGLSDEIKYYRFSYQSQHTIHLAAASLASNLPEIVGNGPPAILIGHSMGGLVARGAVEIYNAKPYVQKIITLGTPHEGSPLANPAVTIPLVMPLCSALGPLNTICNLLLVTRGAAYLRTDGARDLRPDVSESTFLGNLSAATEDGFYSLIAGKLEDPAPTSCGSDFLCFLVEAGGHVLTDSDGIVPVTSAYGRSTFNSTSFEVPDVGRNYNHLRLHTGKTAVNDEVLSKVAELVRDQADKGRTITVAQVPAELEIGEEYFLYWTTRGISPNAPLDISVESGAVSVRIATGIANTGSHRLIVPEVQPGSGWRFVVTYSETGRTTIRGQSADFAIRSNLVAFAHYPLDGNVQDYSGNQLHGTLAGGQFTTDRFGNAGSALDLDGNDDRVILPAASTNSASEGTVSLWVQFDMPTTAEACRRTDLGSGSPFYCHYNIFAKQSANTGFRAQIGTTVPYSQPANTFYFTVSGEATLNSYVPPNSYSFSSWHMYTFTWNSTAKRIYLDGNLLHSVAGPYISPAGGDLYVGSPVPGPFDFREWLNGRVDDIRIYRRALSASEIADLANAAGMPRPEELSYANNLGYFVLHVGSVAAQPDLVVEGITSTQHHLDSPSGTWAVNFRVVNVGPGGTVAQGSTLAAYLSTDGVVSPDDRLLSEVAVPQLASGAVHLGSINVDIPAGYEYGQYYRVLIVADARNVVAELNENANDNFYWLHIGTPSRAIGDLTVEGVMSPTQHTVLAGQSWDMQFRVHNMGQGPIQVPTTARVYLSRDRVVSADDVSLGAAVVNPLAAGAFQDVVHRVSVPNGYQNGYAYILVETNRP